MEGKSPTPRKNAAGGGVLIALGSIIGAFAGVTMGESTRGFFLGTAIGVALAVLLWLRDRNR